MFDAVARESDDYLAEHSKWLFESSGSSYLLVKAVTDVRQTAKLSAEERSKSATRFCLADGTIKRAEDRASKFQLKD